MTDPVAGATTRAAVEAHLLAFNSHDTSALLQGVDPAVVWSTGQDVVRGRDQLLGMFADWLWSLRPRLEVIQLVVEGDLAAAQCVEHLVIEGDSVAVPIAVFFTVRDGLLQSVKVFREGTADVALVE